MNTAEFLAAWDRWDEQEIAQDLAQYFDYLDKAAPSRDEQPDPEGYDEQR